LKLTDLIPTTDVLLALEPEELAGFILEYFQSKGDPNKFQEHPDNFPISTELQGYNRDKERECTQALMEAWNILEREGSIVRKPGGHGWYILSRRAKRIKTKQDYEIFRHAKLFPKDTIHPDLTEGVYPLFIRGDYETAVFKAFKLVEVAVREAAGPGFESLYGTDLMLKAFHSETGPMTDRSEQTAERQALQFLFAGAIGRFKNPSSHRHVAITNPNEAIEMIQLASHLLRVISDRNRTEGKEDRKQ
jgi:uncharacterized protein (TIGR02391 family)